MTKTWKQLRCRTVGEDVESVVFPAKKKLAIKS